MPYDPRPISQGGNRGIDEQFSRKAPRGMYRVIGVDTFDGGDWLDGDYDTLDAAIKVAQAKGGTMTVMYIYDDEGRTLGSKGTF